jgi:hypothetical protein
MPSDHLAPSDHGSAHPASDRAKALARAVTAAAWECGSADGYPRYTELAEASIAADRALLDYIAELEKRDCGGEK